MRLLVLSAVGYCRCWVWISACGVFFRHQRASQDIRRAACTVECLPQLRLLWMIGRRVLPAALDFSLRQRPEVLECMTRRLARLKNVAFAAQSGKVGGNPLTALRGRICAMILARAWLDVGTGQERPEQVRVAG